MQYVCMISRRDVLGLAAVLAMPLPARAGKAEAWAQKLVNSAKAQIGVTTAHDSSYRKLDFPGGDVPRQAGVCTDVIIRAFRDALDIDLQQLDNQDMKAAFGKYPKTWGLKRPDPNIDHRRVPNLQTYFARIGAGMPVTSKGSDYMPGDLVTQMLPGNLAHVALVVDDRSADQSRQLVVHNIGRGVRMEDTLFAFSITGHFRIFPARRCKSDISCAF